MLRICKNEYDSLSFVKLSGVYNLRANNYYSMLLRYRYTYITFSARFGLYKKKKKCYFHCIKKKTVCFYYNPIVQPAVALLLYNLYLTHHSTRKNQKSMTKYLYRPNWYQFLKYLNLEFHKRSSAGSMVFKVLFNLPLQFMDNIVPCGSFKI